MHSHGLKTWDHDDIQEGNAIADGLRGATSEGDGK